MIWKYIEETNIFYNFKLFLNRVTTVVEECKIVED